MRGRKRHRKKLAKAVLAWERELMKHIRETCFTFAAGFHLIDAVFDDIEEERPNDSSATA